jgi:MoaA/NifB/PqqE/SkfB family radical SAM enzyme
MNNYAQDIRQFRNLGGMAEAEKIVSCYAPFQALHIDKKGWCRPCPFSFIYLPSGYKNLSNWSPTNKLLDIWNSDIIEKMRDNHIMGNIDSIACNYCAESCKEGKPPSSLDFDWVGGKRNINHAYPKELELELSNKCNYMCNACGPWCSSKHMEKLGLQNDSKYKSIFDDPEISKIFIEDLRSIIHHVYRINFTGGEPFAQRIVYDIIKMINEENPKELHIHFTTNGSVMNGMVKKLAARPNTHFTISLDSIDPIKYPLIRVNGELDNVMSNINIIQSLCTGIIGCSFVIQRDNVYDLPKIVSWCNEKGIVFTYHILSEMGGLGWTKLRRSIQVENKDNEYLKKLKEYLLLAKIKTKDNLNSEKNIKMFKQYIKRL